MPSWSAPERSGSVPEGKLNGVVRVAIVGIEQIVPLLGIDRMIGQGIDQLSGRSGTLDRLVPGLSATIRETANASVIENLKKMGEPTTIDNRPAISAAAAFCQRRDLSRHVAHRRSAGAILERRSRPRIAAARGDQLCQKRYPKRKANSTAPMTTSLRVRLPASSPAAPTTTWSGNKCSSRG